MHDELQKLSTKELKKRKKFNFVLQIILFSLAIINLFTIYLSGYYILLTVVFGVILIEFLLNSSRKKISIEIRHREETENSSDHATV